MRLTRTTAGIGPDRLEVHGRGDINLILSNGNSVTLKNACYVPDAMVNIFSVRGALKMLGRGAEHRETLRSCKLMSADGTAIVTGSERRGLYFLDLAAQQEPKKAPLYENGGNR